jgi:hypothetical protein
LRSKNLDEASDYLDKVVYNIELLNLEMKDVPFFEIPKKTLDDFRQFLKYKVYLNLSNKENIDKIDINTLEKIEIAFETNDLILLSSLLENKTFENVDESIVLPHENPAFFKRKLDLIQGTIINSFYDNFLFRLTSIIAFLLIIGYTIAKKTSVEFDTTFISALLFLGSVIAKEIKQKR